MDLNEMFRGTQYFPFGGGDVLATAGTLHADSGFSKDAVFLYNCLMLFPHRCAHHRSSFVKLHLLIN